MWGPNAAGKTSLLEAIVLAAWGRSHRTAADGELVRWGQELARVEARVGEPDTEVGSARRRRGRPRADRVRRRPQADPRQRRRPPGRGAGRASCGRSCSRPRRCCWSRARPSLRREALDRLAGQRSPAYLRDLATYGRALQQRNGLLRLIREEQATRAELRFWDGTLLEAGSAVRAERHRLLEALAGPLAAAHAEIAPDEAAAGRLAADLLDERPAARPGSRFGTPSPGGSPRPPRRRSGTARR